MKFYSNILPSQLYMFNIKSLICNLKKLNAILCPTFLLPPIFA